MTVTRRLLIPILLGISIAIAVLVLIHMSIQDRLIVERENARVEEVNASFQAMVADRGHLAQALASTVAHMPELQQLFAERRRQELLEVVQPIYRELGLRHRVVQLEFHIPDAQTFLRLNHPQSFGDDVSDSRPSVVLGNLDRSPQSGLEVDVAGIAIRGLVPVVHRGRYVGTLGFGIGLDNFFLEQFKSRQGADCAVYLKREVVEKATLIPIPHSHDPQVPELDLVAQSGLEQKFPNHLFTQALGGEDILDRVASGDDHYVVSIRPLRSSDGEILGVTRISIFRGNVLRAMAAGRNTSVALGAAICILTLLTVWSLTMRTIIRPLSLLTKGAQGLQGGERSVRVSLRGKDELAQLGTAFNAMADEIGDLLTGLEQRVEDRTRELKEEISERIKAEKELDRHRAQLEDLIGERTAELTLAKEQAEAANRAKSDFLARMSHELRTPLNAILGYAQILRRQPNITEKQKQQLEVMKGSGEHLLKLINDVLDVGKIEAEKMEVEDLAFDLPGLLGQAINLTRVQAEEKELEFVFEEATALPPYVRGDEGKLRQVLLNLLSNAVKYTRQGKITLRVSYNAAGCGVLRCEVRDTGVGIPAEKQETVFEPFAQLVSERQARQGTGLGLHITKSLVLLMNGRIGVQSTPGQGSCFWVELALPVIGGTVVSTGEVGVRVCGYIGERRRILVVDDNPANTTMVESFLQELGFDVHTAQNGREALERATACMPHLVVMDLIMPTMDGLEALNAMKCISALSFIPILGASATLTPDARRDEFMRRCDDFIGKPIALSDLVERMGKLLGIQWKREPGVSRDAVSRFAAEELIVPPAADLEELYMLAMLGDMDRVEAWARDLLRKGEGYRGFSDKLMELAGGFRTRALLALVERYRGVGK